MGIILPAMLAANDQHIAKFIFLLFAGKCRKRKIFCVSSVYGSLPMMMRMLLSIPNYFLLMRFMTSMFGSLRLAKPYRYFWEIETSGILVS